MSKVKVVKIKRKGFEELTPKALEALDRAIKDVVEDNVRPLEDFLKELEESSK